MAGTGVRTTIGGIGHREISRRPGDLTGLQINTFVLDKMIAGLNGEALAPIAIEAWEPAFAQAQAEWPKWTHASVDSMRVWVTDVEAHKVRVALSVGGIRLIQDSRNKSGKDYAPYIEFNGTKTAAPGTIQRAVEDNRDAMKQIARAGALALLKGMGR